jgi:TPR repeat protein
MRKALVLLCSAMLLGCSDRAARERARLEKDAAQGSIRARLSLAELYASGSGVPKDDAKAA